MHITAITTAKQSNSLSSIIVLSLNNLLQHETFMRLWFLFILRFLSAGSFSLEITFQNTAFFLPI